MAPTKLVLRRRRGKLQAFLDKIPFDSAHLADFLAKLVRFRSNCCSFVGHFVIRSFVFMQIVGSTFIFDFFSVPFPRDFHQELRQPPQSVHLAILSSGKTDISIRGKARSGHRLVRER